MKVESTKSEIQQEAPAIAKLPVMPSLQSLNFKSMRKAKGLTLRQVEDITGISNSYLSQLETGKIKAPSYNTVRTLVMLYSNEA